MRAAVQSFAQTWIRFQLPDERPRAKILRQRSKGLEKLSGCFRSFLAYRENLFKLIEQKDRGPMPRESAAETINRIVQEQKKVCMSWKILTDSSNQSLTKLICWAGTSEPITETQGDRQIAGRSQTGLKTRTKQTALAQTTPAIENCQRPRFNTLEQGVDLLFASKEQPLVSHLVAQQSEPWSFEIEISLRVEGRGGSGHYYFGGRSFISA
jgi:hypothetical protein